MKKQGKVLEFMKKYAGIIVVAFCIIAIGLSVTLVVIGKDSFDSAVIDNVTPVINNGQEDVNPTIEDTDKPILFISPVLNAESVSAFCETVAYNQTLKRYQSHMGIDFFAESGTPVMAVYDGVIESVDNSIVNGYTVTINHGNGLKTVYNSLLDGDLVSVGDTVKSGDIIGEVSVSNRQEYLDGAHLHFETIENGVKINPEKYLVLNEK